MLTMLPQPLDRLMATVTPQQIAGGSSRRPTANSSSRVDTNASAGRKSRSRASTLQSDKAREDSTSSRASSLEELQGTVTEGDLFAQSPISMDDEKMQLPTRPRPASPRSVPTRSMPEPVEELPIELASLADRFIDSLSAKVHPTPPTVEKLSELFQDFYVLAATHINTHISTLSSRQQRDFSTGPSGVPLRKSSRPTPERSGSEQQMLTASEMEDRKKARRGLEKKRGLLEEAVERKACEAVYDRIWRHRSTHDEEQDEKLRSKTAALGVVGIGLAELGIRIETEPLQAGSGTTTEEDVRRWLGEARDELVKMNDERHPLGKLLHLKAAHKAIVDTLSRMHPSSSSADDILPTMIYTLITTPVEGINVISNLYFVQRFRAENKIDGEAAYCLTNLEAAITFLETVDLASLRADEAPSGPPRPASQPSTPPADRAEFLAPTPTSAAQDRKIAPDSPLAATSSNTSTAGTLVKPAPISSRPHPPSSPLHQRRLSHLLHQPSYALNTASDAVMTRADQSLKTITNTLEGSYNLLFGRLRERQLSGAGVDSDGHIVVPTTLDEARKLVGSSPRAGPEDDGSASGASSIAPLEEDSRKDPPSSAGAGSGTGSLLGLIGGRHPGPGPRDRSSDSTRSDRSSKRVASSDKENTPGPLTSLPPAAHSMRNLTTTLNPLNRLATLGGGSITAMRNFGRSASSTTASTVPPTASADALPTDTPPLVSPPIHHFLALENPGDLKISEVLELLRDYRRLAAALGERGAFGLSER